MPKIRIRDAAAYLSVSDDTVRRWIDAGMLPVETDDQNRKVVDGYALAVFAREQASPMADPSLVERSARNRFVGLVTRIVRDTVMAQVELQCGPYRVVSLMTSEAVDDLDLELGSVAVAVVKSTTVIIETPLRSNVKKILALPVAAALLLAGCSNPATTPAEPAGSPSASAPGGTLTVFAAASLKGTFTTLGQKFEASHPGTKVTFSFAGSADLVTQLQGGAPADVFASADTKNMDKATGDNLVSGSPVTFASNTLEIAVPPDNPAKVTSLQDLTKSSVKVVLCAPEVPCGSAAQKVETAAKIDIKPVSEESSVTDVLNKVQTGEADAGLVYVTDVKGAGDKVKGVTFPESSSAVNAYPIATLTASENADLAKEFVTLVTGTEGQQVLADAGFAKP